MRKCTCERVPYRRWDEAGEYFLPLVCLYACFLVH